MSRFAPQAVLTAALILAGFTTIAGAAEVTPQEQQQQVAYEPSTATFTNPERGFYHQQGECQQDAFTEEQLRDYQTEDNVTLAMCVFYLNDFRTSDISPAAIAFLQQQLDTFRAAGSKAILRFAYDQNGNEDATKDRMVTHLEQLKPVLQKNADVIAVMQAGMIGQWGEWYSTKNFGDTSDPSADAAARRAVVDKQLEVLPESRFVQVRTPRYKKAMYPSGNARVGHHNDCFLSTGNDTGTFIDPAEEIPSLARDTATTPMGGETCTPTRATCAVADQEMSRFHYSFLNRDWNDTVIAKFKTDGCLDDIDKKLGYRLTLTEGTYPSTAQNQMRIQFKITNDGYAAPFNPRNVNLVLGASHRIPLKADPRRWTAGTTTTVDETVTIPSSIPAGTYKLALELPDPLLPNRPEYSIRTANNALWDPATGLNNLNASVTIP